MSNVSSLIFNCVYQEISLDFPWWFCFSILVHGDTIVLHLFDVTQFILFDVMKINVEDNASYQTVIGKNVSKRLVMASSPLLKKRKVEGRVCVICTRKCGEPQKRPSKEDWCTFKETAKEWKRVRGKKYSHVYDSVFWDGGPEGVIWHKNCKWQMMNGER